MLSNSNVEDGGRQSDSVLDSLEPGVFAIVLSFVNPRGLLHLSMCCKRYSQGTRIHHDHVVSSALLSGGQAKRTVTQVIEMALPSPTNAPSDTSIHLPSPLRLLRLINGTRCESRACMSAVTDTTICPYFGLFLCWDCFLGITTAIDLQHETLAGEKRLARLFRQNAHVLTTPFTDTSGERAGPIISWDVASGAADNEQVQTLLNQADQAWPPKTFEIIRRSIRDNNVQGANRYQEVGLSLTDTVLLMNRLKGMLEERHCPYSDILCSFDECRHPSPDGPGMDLSCIVFYSNMVDELIDELVHDLASHPIGLQNQVIERQMQEIADYLCQAMQTLHETNFLDFSFLDENNPWESGLREHFRTQEQPHFALRSINGDMLDEIRQGDVFGAMKWLENNYSINPRNDPDRPIGNWADVVAAIVLVQNVSMIRQYPLITETCARDLAKIVYIDLVAQSNPSVVDDNAVNDDDDDEEDNNRAEFTRQCNVAAAAFQELLPLTQVLIAITNAVALLDAGNEPRVRQAKVNSITAQLGKLRGNVVTRFRNRKFVSIVDELRQNLR
ncbi:hypothetical protein MHU86_12048 [Fragilaria crotonensis]|nr:hypothetical protein MHU86_12048 [Fragilaria crotonensis]